MALVQEVYWERGKWRESKSKRPCQSRSKKRHERKEGSRKERRGKKKKEEAKRGVRIKRDKTQESQLCLAGTLKGWVHMSHS